MAVDYVLIRKISKAVTDDNVDELDVLFTTHPDLFMFADDLGTWLHIAAQYNSLKSLAYFLKGGIPIDFPDRKYADTPLTLAAMRNRYEAAEWLLKHGANPDGDSNSFSPPIISAISSRDLDLVKLFIDNGASTDFTFGEPPRNALDFAKKIGTKDIEAYLLSIGMVPGDVHENKPSYADEVREYLEDSFDEIAVVQAPVIVDNIDLIVALPSEARNCSTLMTISKQQTSPRQFELLANCLPSWYQEGVATGKHEIWLINLLSDVHAYLSDEPDLLNKGFLVIEFTDEQKSVSRFDSILLATENSRFGHCEFESGNSVQFCSVIPLYKEERLLEYQQGIVSLFNRFQEHDIKPVIDIHRKNVAA